MGDSPFWTAKEAAAYARVARGTILEHVRAGRLQACRIPVGRRGGAGRRGELRIRREWVEAWLGLEAEPTPPGGDARRRQGGAS